MKLKLSSKEASLVRQGLADVVANSPNFADFEKEHLMTVYRRLRRYENKKFTPNNGRRN